jgi:alpha-glucoside transport system permease protein
MTQDAGATPGDPLAASSNPVGIGAVTTMERLVTGEDAEPAKRRRVKKSKAPGESRWVAGVFLLPAVVFLAAIVVYPFIYTIVRSLFKDGPSGDPAGFAGLSNYSKIFTDGEAFRSLKNNLIWVLVVPAVATFFGLMFAVLTERIRWASAFKIVLFMPMAISFLASGVTWSLIYADQPSRGLGNALAMGIHDTFSPSTSYPGLHPVGTDVFSGTANKGYTSHPFSSSSPALLPLAGFNVQKLPSAAKQAAVPSGNGVRGVVWNDFALGGGGKRGAVDKKEVGVPKITVQAVQGGKVVGSALTKSDGSFTFSGLKAGSYSFRLPSSDFSQPYGGISWLGPTLITWSIIIAYLWIYAGFCMVLLSAGMAAIPRDALEAARMDGATELQVFRRVTVPLLAPVLMVVFVTMVINVLKIFDIVFVIGQTAGANQGYATVLAVQLFNDYGNQQFGAASAVGIVLVILVIPAMIFQVYRFRKDQR